MKKLAILGCSGSIGKTTMNIIRNYPLDFSVEILVNNTNILELQNLMAEFNPKYALCVSLKLMFINGEKVPYDEGFLSNKESFLSCDLVINGIVGIAGLLPSIATIMADKPLATANKESLVCGGGFINDLLAKHNSKILPMDSEHSTIWRCLSDDVTNVESIILTASGGAFRNLTKAELKNAKASDALRHPTWIMGKKVTIDCATLMNKGMEIIEAKWLFHTNKIDVLQHNESIIHSLVLLKDGTFIAGLSTPDMTIPIQYALTYPKVCKTSVKTLDLATIRTLNFGDIDEDNFPCLAIAKEVSRYGDTQGTIMNSANEVMVELYLNNSVGFYDISNYIKTALDKFSSENCQSIEEIVRMDIRVREYLYSILGGC